MLPPTMNNIVAVVMCVALRTVSTIVSIYSLLCVSFLLHSKLIFSVFFAATEPREQKPSGRRSPVFPQYETVGAGMLTFKQWPLSAENLSEARFFVSGKYFTIYCLLYMQQQQQFI